MAWYYGTLGAASNRAKWEGTLTVTDADDVALFTLATAATHPEAVTLTFRDPSNGSEPLSISLGDGITVTGDGILSFAFTKAQMNTLAPKTYEVGVLITTADETDPDQLILGTLAVHEGL